MLIRVIFVSQRQAERMDGRQTAALVSITDPGVPGALLSPGWGGLLRLSFHDADPVTFPDSDRHLTGMSIEQAIAVRRFIAALPAKVRSLVIHCRSGISRSASLAKAVAEVHGLYHDATYAEFNRHVHAMARSQLLNAESGQSHLPSGSSQSPTYSERDIT
jgi:predicted protein tyrosine phosphatase